MRLWTLQTEDVYSQLIKTGRFRCNPALSECIAMDPEHFTNAYNWLKKQMENRIGPAPYGVIYPVWAWYVIRGRRGRPDFRWREIYFREPMVCMEIEIPDEQVLLSDEDLWHIVLNDMYCFTDDEDYDRWDALPEPHRTEEKEKSWEIVFEMNGQPYVQATFWELKREQVKRIWHLKQRLSHD